MTITPRIRAIIGLDAMCFEFNVEGEDIMQNWSDKRFANWLAYWVAIGVMETIRLQ